MKQTIYLLIDRYYNQVEFEQLNKQEFSAFSVEEFIARIRKEYGLSDIIYCDDEELLSNINAKMIDVDKYKVAKVELNIIPSVPVFTVVSLHDSKYDDSAVTVLGVFTNYDDAYEVMMKDYNDACNSMKKTYGEENLDFSETSDFCGVFTANDEEMYQVEIHDKILNK